MAASQLQGRSRLSTQLTRFVLVGGVAAIVDYSSYQALLYAGLWVHLAKALGFIAGTTTAYLINRRWTFQGRGDRTEFAAVMALSGSTFVVQVGVNAAVLARLPRPGAAAAPGASRYCRLSMVAQDAPLPYRVRGRAVGAANSGALQAMARAFQ